MPKLLFIFASSFALSSTPKPQFESTNQSASISCCANPFELNSDSVTLKNNFLVLSNAIKSGDREGMKSFIDFPILNPGNEIWYLADSRFVMSIKPDPIKPFLQSDFDKYFSSLFAMDLRKTLATVDVDKLFKVYKSTSLELVIVNGSRSKLEVIYDKHKRKLTMNLLTIIEGHIESTYKTYYHFDVLNGKDIRFKHVHVTF